MSISKRMIAAGFNKHVRHPLAGWAQPGGDGATEGRAESAPEPPVVPKGRKSSSAGQTFLPGFGGAE